MRHLIEQLWKQADLLALALALVIAILSLLPPDRLPEVGVSDKLEHLLAYVLLGLLATLRRRHWGHIALALLSIVAYGAAIEYLQPYFGRTMELGDVVADSIGALAGALIARWLPLVPALRPSRP